MPTPDQQPLTEAQLDLIAAETKRASSKALSRYSSSALVGFLLLVIGIGIVYNVGQSHDDAQRKATREVAARQAKAVAQSGRAVAVEGCNRDFRTISAVRASYQSAAALTEQAAKRGEIPAKQVAVARKFYADQLKKLVLPDCRKAAKVLTTNPELPITVPKPLHP